MRIFILFALAGAAAALAVPRHINRIVGGEETTIQQYPYMSSMLYAWFGIVHQQTCGGSLLTSRIVLSASHCYIDLNNPSLWQVRLGSSRAAGGGFTYEVSHFIIHEDYDEDTLDNDIALAVLKTSAILGSGAGVARIPGITYDAPDGAIVTAIGWGHTTVGGSSAQLLRHVHINVINLQLCTERYAYLKTQPGYQDWPVITDGMLCAGVLDVGGKDACQGDSGGPLAYLNDIVVGVTSWGFGCGDPYYPGVNARVSYFSNWIVEHAAV